MSTPFSDSPPFLAPWMRKKAAVTKMVIAVAAPAMYAAEFARQFSLVARKIALRTCGPATMTNAMGRSERKVTRSWTRPRRPESDPEQLLLLGLEVLGRDYALIAQLREPFELGGVVGRRGRGGGRRGRHRLFGVGSLVLGPPPLFLSTPDPTRHSDGDARPGGGADQ